MNRWNVIALYAGIICLISMSCILFHVVIASQSILKLTVPWYLETNGYGVNMNYQDNQSYLYFRCPAMRANMIMNESKPPIQPCPLAGKSADEITILRKKDEADYHERQTENFRLQAKKSLLDGVVSIAISLVFFLIHWRILRRSLASPMN